MSSSPPENGCSSTECLKTKKKLKSAVISDDSLKIKLKISKTDIADFDDDNKDEEAGDEKCVKSHRNSISGKSELKNGDEKVPKKEVSLSENDRSPRISNAGDPKMKLRSKKEVEDECEDKKEEGEVREEKRKRKESLSEKGCDKRPPNKRIKITRYQSDENLEKNPGVRRSRRNESYPTVEKTKEVVEDFKEINKESFCWTCHKDGSVVRCDTCPRVFHLKCVSLTKDPSKDWICPECSLVLHAEKISTRSEAMKSLSLDQLCTLLNFAIGRMRKVPESQAFWKPVDPKEVPYYDKYITNPMDLNLLERNMKAKMYGSPQAFLADAKWLLHNSIIFNSTQSPLTSTARCIVKICRQEMAEIENCPDCYLNAHTKKDWFIEVCRKPHILIWARLKGFPFWPAKAMSTNLKTQQVDARFFGAHDKAWVPVKECYLYSKNSPQLLSKKRTDLDEAFLEADGYIKKIRQKYGSFSYAPDKTPFMPEMYDKQLQSMIPNYKEEKPVKKKKKSDPIIAENGVEKPLLNGKKIIEYAVPQKVKLKRALMEEASKLMGDICSVNDYISEEKVASDDRVSPEDEIARSLEMFDTHKKEEGVVLDENSTDLDEDGSVPIPEHGYSRSVENLDAIQSVSNVSRDESQKVNAELDSSVVGEKQGAESSERVKKITQKVVENECIVESSDGTKLNEVIQTEKVFSSIESSDQCEVSTSADSKVTDEEHSEDAKNTKNVETAGKTDIGNVTEKTDVSHVAEKTEITKNIECVERTECNESTKEENQFKNRPTEDLGDKEKMLTPDSSKKDDDKSPKSFGNLSCDQKQKILTEAKLLANIDEMTALGKQKVLNDLGLDASQVDIKLLAQENRQILETLNKKCQNERKGFEEVSIKSEDFEQYLMEENSEENVFDEVTSTSSKCGSIKVRDFQSLARSKSKSPSPVQPCNEPMLKITDVQSLRESNQTMKEPNFKRKKSQEESKKVNLDPVIKLIKLDVYDKSVEKLNRKLRLSDEVSLLMVDGEKKVNVDVECVSADGKKNQKNVAKPPRAKKSMPNKSKLPAENSKTSPKNISVISVDTENSAAQKNLLKSLCLEEKKQDDSSRKTVLITTNDKGIKNVNIKDSGETSTKKQIKDVTIEAVKEVGKGVEVVKEGNSPAQKNLAVMTNSHLIVTNTGPAIVTNQNNQSNLALAQNNLGQLSLVHLSNLTSGIQTNFINLTNETIGFNAVYASPGFGGEFPASTGTGSVILTPSLTTTTLPGGASPTPKLGKDSAKSSANRTCSNKPTSGISVKSPASLGLVSTPSSKLPPVITIPGEGIPIVGEVGSVTAELNKHSVKMAEYMRATIEDLLRELSNQGSLEAKCKLLTIEMEKMQWRHQQEIMELKHHSERSMMELRNTLETEKQKCIGELKAQLESQHQKVISETKRKQWCANCGKEALFYCCWNTSYCDYPCQQQHWPGHMSTCAQLGNNVSLGAAAGSQLQGKTSGVKYQSSNYVPVMSRGGGGSGGSNGGDGGSHTGSAFAANRAIPTVQAHSSQNRRSSDPAAPQLPINITIRPQNYFL